MDDEANLPVDKPLTFRGFLWVLAKSLPHAFRRAGDLTSLVLFLLGTVVLAFNRQIAETLFKSEGVDPRWALVPLLVLFAYEFLRINHRIYLQEFGRGQTARLGLLTLQQKASTAPHLSQDVLTVEQTALPVTNERTGFHVGTCLGLRCTNIGDDAVDNCRIRVLNLERQIHDDEWEQEDFFRAAFLLWEEGHRSETIVPGGQRICEVAKQHHVPQLAIVPRRPVGKQLTSGHWRITLDLEADDHVARHLVLHFEWRAPGDISPGGGLRWKLQ